MKLPEEIKRLACGQQAPTISPVYEAIVRDCAKVAASRFIYGHSVAGPHFAEATATAILARYGLEPKP